MRRLWYVVPLLIVSLLPAAWDEDGVWTSSSTVTLSAVAVVSDSFPPIKQSEMAQQYPVNAPGTYNPCQDGGCAEHPKN